MAPADNKPLSLTTEQTEIMEKFRQRLTAMNVFEDYRLKSNNFLLRYLRANSFNMEKSLKMIDAYLDIHKQYNTDQIMTQKYPKDFADNFVTYVGGKDVKGRPIAMIPHGGLWNLKQAIQNGQEEVFVHYVLKVALVFEKMVLERDSDYGLLVCDVSNVAYGNYFHKRTLEVLLMLVNMVERISPGIIRKVYFVNAPKLWIALFNTVRALVTVSADIYAMDSNEKKWKASLQEFIPEDGICAHFGGICNNFEII